MPKVRGLAVSRRGRPALGLQTLIDRLQKKKPKRVKLSAVSLEEAQNAASVLERSRGRAKRFRDASIVGGVLSPVTQGAGRAIEAGLLAPRGQRAAAALRGFSHPTAGNVRGLLSTNRGEIAKQVFLGGVGGSVVNASREGLEVGRARRSATNFLKAASLNPLPLGKRRILMSAGDVWGHNTVAARNALEAAGHKVHDARAFADTIHAGGNHVGPRAFADTIRPGATHAAEAATETAAPVVRRPNRLARGLGVLAGGTALGTAGAFATRAPAPLDQQKVAAGLRRSIPNLAAKLQPVPTSKLSPIVDNDVEFEI